MNPAQEQTTIENHPTLASPLQPYRQPLEDAISFHLRLFRNSLKAKSVINSLSVDDLAYCHQAISTFENHHPIDLSSTNLTPAAVESLAWFQKECLRLTIDAPELLQPVKNSLHALGLRWYEDRVRNNKKKPTIIRPPSKQPGYIEPGRRNTVALTAHVPLELREDINTIAKLLGLTTQEFLVSVLSTVVEKVQAGEGLQASIAEAIERRSSAQRTTLSKAALRLAAAALT